MADESVATLTNLLRDQRGPLVEALRWGNVFMAEIERETSEESFDGLQVKVPIITAPAQGTGFGTEAGILNAARELRHGRVLIDTGIVNHTVGFTSKAVLAASKVGDTGWIDIVPTRMRMAEEALKRTINESFLGAGDALIAAVTSAGSATTTVTVGTNANFYALYADRIVDVLNRTTGATVSLGRRVTDVDETAGTVTVDVAITTATTDGLFYEGSFGNAIAGMGAATATTGTFQSLDKAAAGNSWWKGTDATPAAASDLSIGILDRAERKAYQRSGSKPKFYVADPAVLDKFTQGMTVQARWDGEKRMLDTGWSGVEYLDKRLIKEFDMPGQTVYGVFPEDIRVYTRDEGPDWDEKDGMFKRFARALPYEAWLIWHLQLGFHRCNSAVKIGSLNRAA